MIRTEPMRGSYWRPGKVIMLLLCCIFSGYAQDPEYEAWLKKEQQKLQEYKDARDKDFINFLKREWKQRQAFEGLVPDERPKPKSLPTVEPSETPRAPVPSAPARVKSEAPSEPVPALEPKEVAVPPPSPTPNVLEFGFNFFDLPLVVRHEKTAWPKLEKEVSKETISTFWADLSRTTYETVLAQAGQERARLRLNDWGYTLLLHQIGLSLFKGSLNESTLFTWFMLVKSGFDVRIGYGGERVRLLVPTVTRLYQVMYFQVGSDDRRLYAVPLQGDEKSIEGMFYVYEGSYPGADRQADFSVKSLPALRDESAPRQLRFIYGKQDYRLDVAVDKGAVEFFRNYPQTEYTVYFESPASSRAARSLVAQLKPILQGKTEWEAVNILLRFVQTAFEYKTDHDQFGREKPLFVDEVLFYPASDCEDRSVLFAYLVRTLLGMDVVALDYPAHIATAVRFTSEVAGDQVTYEGKKFVICDPTYIGADAGMCMEQFKGVNPKVIRIE
ncbi:MAG: hypothetical protein HYZ01_00025 [Ignavibacteriales bacterium]|nr:hypothetical protein [Ignavibacteriales bacterium]